MEVRGGARFKSEEVERFILGARGGRKDLFLMGNGVYILLDKEGVWRGGGILQFLHSHNGKLRIVR